MLHIFTTFAPKVMLSYTQAVETSGNNDAGAVFIQYTAMVNLQSFYFANI